MTISIHQPNFLPWFGYFHKLAHADAFILFDDVQYPRGKTLINRVKIKTQNGEHYITVPVSGRSELLPIRQIPISDGPHLKKIARTLEVTYKRATHFQEVFECLFPYLYKEHDSLCSLNIGLITSIVQRLNLKTELVQSSKLQCNLQGEAKIICLLKRLNGSVYISGTGAGSKRHIDEDHFREAGIKLIWQSFNHPIYDQLYGNEFTPNLSIIDVLFNLGFNQTSELLKQTPLTM